MLYTVFEGSRPSCSRVRNLRCSNLVKPIRVYLVSNTCFCDPGFLSFLFYGNARKWHKELRYGHKNFIRSKHCPQILESMYESYAYSQGVRARALGALWKCNFLIFSVFGPQKSNFEVEKTICSGETRISPIAFLGPLGVYCNLQHSDLVDKFDFFGRSGAQCPLTRKCMSASNLVFVH